MSAEANSYGVRCTRCSKFETECTCHTGHTEDAIAYAKAYESATRGDGRFYREYCRQHGIATHTAHDSF